MPGHPRSMPCILSILAALVLWGPTAARAQTEPPVSVEQLQWWGWPENMSSIFGAAIADSGQIVISGNRDDFVQGGYLLNAAGLWEERYATENRMVDVNDTGRIAGWVSGRPLNPDSSVHAFYWQPGQAGETSEPQEPSAADGVRAVGIDENGNVYGTVTLDQAGSRTLHPFRWGTQFEVVSSLVGVEAMASNDRGQIALRRYTESGYVLSVLDPDDSVFQLPIPDYAWTYPNDINDAGHLVGDAENEDLTVDEAFLWDGEAYTILPRPGSFTQADAEAINDDGQIVGWGWDGSFGGIVWVDGEAHDLSVLASQAFGETIRLRKAYDISNLGWIVGWGYPAGAGSPQVFALKLGRGCPDPDSGEGTVAWAAGEGNLEDPANWETASVPSSEDVVLFADLPGALSPVVHFGGPAQHAAAVIKSSAALLSLDLGGHTWSLGDTQDCLPALSTREDGGDLGIWYVQGGTVAARGAVDLRHGGVSSLQLTDGTQLLVEEGPVLMGHADTTNVSLQGAGLNATSRVLLGPNRGEAGRLDLDASSLVTPALTIGDAGWGGLELVDSDLQAEEIFLGHTVDGVGTLVVDAVDAVSHEVLAQQVMVGSSGRAEIELLGGLFTNDVLQLGWNATADGELRAYGPVDLTTRYCQIGVGGWARVEILEGARFRQGSDVGSSVLDLGVELASEGTLVIAGGDTRAELRNVAVGIEGTGRLEVDGALVDVHDWLSVGHQTGGVGRVTVIGGGILDVDSLTVAPSAGATGEVNVSSGVMFAPYVEVGPGGSVQGQVLSLETVELDGTPKRSPAASADLPGLRVQSLVLRAGASVLADSVVFGSGWTLGGDGAVPFDLVNNARLEPGPAGEPGELRVEGDFVQTDEGLLHIEVFVPEDLPAGPTAKRATLSSDRLRCTGAATLGGVLEIALSEDVEMELGDRIALLEAASINGSFEEVRLPSGMEVETEITSGELTLLVTAAPLAVSSIDLRWDGASRLAWTADFLPVTGTWVVEGSVEGRDWRRVAAVAAGPESGSGPIPDPSLTLESVAEELRLFRVHWHDASGERRVSSGVLRRVTPSAVAVAMSPVHPNPFNPRASVSLRLDEPGPVRLRVLDLRGRTLEVLHEGMLAGGRSHSFVLDGQDWASGVYMVEAEGPGFRRSRKFTVVK